MKKEEVLKYVSEDGYKLFELLKQFPVEIIADALWAERLTIENNAEQEHIGKAFDAVLDEALEYEMSNCKSVACSERSMICINLRKHRSRNLSALCAMDRLTKEIIENGLFW